ncbi:UNVERIFIED_CONTAM: hypothetical protein K2H54_004769 [Gekko kuhli]
MAGEAGETGAALPGRSDRSGRVDREALSCCQGDSESLSLPQSAESIRTESISIEQRPQRDTSFLGQDTASQNTPETVTLVQDQHPQPSSQHQDCDGGVVENKQRDTEPSDRQPPDRSSEDANVPTDVTKQYYFENKRALILCERDQQQDRIAAEAVETEETMEHTSQDDQAVKGNQDAEQVIAGPKEPVAARETGQTSEEQEMEVQTAGETPHPKEVTETEEAPQEEEMPLTGDTATYEIPPNQEEFKLQQGQHQYFPPFQLSDTTDPEGPDPPGIYPSEATPPTSREGVGKMVEEDVKTQGEERTSVEEEHPLSPSGAPKE